MGTTSIMKKIKVLLFIKTPPPLTGATLMNKYIADSTLLSKNFNLKIINVTYKENIKQSFKLDKIFKIINYHILLLYNLISFRPNIVYFQLSPLGVAFLRDCTYVLWLKLFNVHTVFHLHGKGINEASKKSKIYKNLYKWAFNNNSIICLSKMLTEDIVNVYSGNPYILNNGIPYNSNVKTERQVKNSKVLILFLSNLIYSKGILDFLDSIDLLKNSYNEKISARVVGHEVEMSKSELLLEIEKRKLNTFVEFLGPKYGKDKDEILYSSDILVFPTLNDVWGLVILEAMQFGIPVIATREGAIPEIVDDGVTGFLVDKHSPDQIAEKIKIFLDDDVLRTKMGKSARKKYLEKYTIEVFEKNLIDVFQKISFELK